MRETSGGGEWGLKETLPGIVGTQCSVQVMFY